MIFNLPNNLPSKEEFIAKFVEAIFPDLESMGFNPKPYGYMNACEKVARELNIYGGDDCKCEIEMRSKVFSLMVELQKYGEEILRLKNNVLEDDNYRLYTSVFYTICNSSSGNLRSWLEPKTNKINISYEATLFLSYLLLIREECVETRRSFIEYVLSVAGISGIEDIISYKLFDLDLSNVKSREMSFGVFDEIQGKGLKLFLATTYVIVFSLGKYDKEKYSDIFERLYGCYKETFNAEIISNEALINAERNLAECIKFFEPRSIVTSQQLYPQDFFVVPSFEKGRENPFKIIKDAQKSRRILIRAKTGLGKSSLLKMASVCMLDKVIGGLDDKDGSVDKISRELGVPEDNYVLFIPAKMFSFCYRNSKYKDWTDDFVTLFFNVMWKLYPSYNFFVEQGNQNNSANDRDDLSETYNVTSELIDYIDHLAASGKLTVLLDSYDEISSGELRDEYLKALTTFYDKYCCYSEGKDVGAHVIITSREMSEETMRCVNNALELNELQDIFEISYLNPEQRKELIGKWDKFLGIDSDESKTRLEQVEYNHFYKDYSVNPYMFSVVCFYLGREMNEITQKYIKALVDKMQKNNRTADLKNNKNMDPIIQDVLRNIVKIMQDIAGETVVNGNSHITRRKIDKYIEKFIDKSELSDEDVERYIERIHEIFVVEVGLIVPADGDDSAYQFINDQIRYELAAKGFQRVLEKDEKTVIYRAEILPSMSSIEEYVGLLIPLICDIEDVQLAELLLSDLAMCDFATSEENRVLVRSMLDLVLNRYGNSILTIDKKGDNVAKYVNRAQREIIMRIMCSPNFSPTMQEKKEMIEAPAYKNNVTWLSDSIKNILL